ncbi:MAG: thioesterase family protein [Polyangiaceae bacterium]
MTYVLRVPYHALDPDKSRSTTPLRVRFCDTDLMGIVHHATYLAYLEAGRVDWLRKRGVTYAEWAAGGLHLPVVEAELRYRKPARFDDLIHVETTLSELRMASLRFSFRILRKEELLIEASTRLACVDDRHTIRRLDASILSVLQAPESVPGEIP